MLDVSKDFELCGVRYSPIHGTGATTTDFSQVAAIFSSPEVFLNLAASIEKERGSRAFFEGEVQRKNPIAPPMLLLEWRKNHWQVLSHEGRHRTRALSNLGVETIPIHLSFLGAWDEEGLSRRRELVFAGRSRNRILKLDKISREQWESLSHEISNEDCTARVLTTLRGLIVGGGKWLTKDLESWNGTVAQMKEIISLV